MALQVKGRGIENAVENAKLINVLGPKGVAPTTLGVNEGSVLAEDVKSGKFEMATEREVIEEMKKTIELINTDDLIYYGAHAINFHSVQLYPAARQGESSGDY